MHGGQMPRLAAIGDIHDHKANLAIVLDRIKAIGVDGILLVGDIGSHDLGRGSFSAVAWRRYVKSVRDIFAQIRRLGAPVLWVAGNHDLPGLSGPGCVDNGSVEKIKGLRVSGIGGAGPDRFGFPYEWSEDDVRARMVPDCDVLLVHCPPRDTPLDKMINGKHVGSMAIRERAVGHPGVLVCGHIHEAAGVHRLEECLCVNPGGLGEPFGKPRVAFIEDTERVWVEDLVDGTQQELVRRP